MAKYDLPPIEFLRECFSCDPDEGIVRWLERPRKHFFDAGRWSAWNEKFAGTEGCVDPLGYVLFGVTYRGTQMRLKGHRVAYALYEGRTDFGDLDHKNRVRHDNRKANLRPATPSQNGANRTNRGQTVLPKGVRWTGTAFEATAKGAAGKTEYLGVFDAPGKAHAAYCEFARSIHGEFFNPGEERPTIFD